MLKSIEIFPTKEKNSISSKLPSIRQVPLCIYGLSKCSTDQKQANANAELSLSQSVILLINQEKPFDHFFYVQKCSHLIL